MHELIITHVVPEEREGYMAESVKEPAHTVVYRFEFEDDMDINQALRFLNRSCHDGGQMKNVTGG
jgi:hypothetical protein